MEDLPVRVDGPAQVALFLYDNDTLIVEKLTDGGDGSFDFTSDIPVPGADSFSLSTSNVHRLGADPGGGGNVPREGCP